MNPQTQFEEIYRLTLPEMEWIMGQLEAPALVGIKMEDLQQAITSTSSPRDETMIRTSLREKGILLPDSSRDIRWEPQARSYLDAVLFPEWAMIVVRDQAREGRRFFRLLRKGKTTVLHSFPNEREHLLGIIRNPEEILQLLLSWFPLNLLPYASARFRMEKKSFDHFASLLVEQKRDEALKTFDPSNEDSTPNRLFLRCLWNATLSGSIAQCRIQGGQTSEGNSIAFLTDGRTGWLVTQPDRSDNEPIRLEIRRAGLDFTAVFRDQVEAFSGKRLPRRTGDPAHNSVQFALTADELAKTLAAINCLDLSKKIYAATSLDTAGNHYEACMARAQRSLVEAGLCKLTEAGAPVLADDLARAVLPIGGGDAMVQIVTSAGGPLENVGVYLSKGSLYTAYFNYGENLQVLSTGRYQDVGTYIQSLFPDFGADSGLGKINARFTQNMVNQVLHQAKNTSERKALLMSEGVPETAARDFAEDASTAQYYSTLTRQDLPGRAAGLEDEKHETPLSIFLLKSPRHSWLIHFQRVEMGSAATVHRDEFAKVIENLVT